MCIVCFEAVVSVPFFFFFRAFCALGELSFLHTAQARFGSSFFTSQIFFFCVLKKKTNVEWIKVASSERKTTNWMKVNGLDWESHNFIAFDFGSRASFMRDLSCFCLRFLLWHSDGQVKPQVLIIARPFFHTKYGWWPNIESVSLIEESIDILIPFDKLLWISWTLNIRPNISPKF